MPGVRNRTRLRARQGLAASSSASGQVVTLRQERWGGSPLAVGSTAATARTCAPRRRSARPARSEPAPPQSPDRAGRCVGSSMTMSTGRRSSRRPGDRGRPAPQRAVAVTERVQTQHGARTQGHADEASVQPVSCPTARTQHGDVEAPKGGGGIGVGGLANAPSRTKSALESSTRIGSRVPSRSCSRMTPSVARTRCPHQEGACEPSGVHRRGLVASITQRPDRQLSQNVPERNDATGEVTVLPGAARLRTVRHHREAGASMSSRLAQWRVEHGPLGPLPARTASPRSSRRRTPPRAGAPPPSSSWSYRIRVRQDQAEAPGQDPLALLPHRCCRRTYQA